MPNQQLIESINRANHILLATREKPLNLQPYSYLDGLGAALGFSLFLNRLGKKTDLVARGYQKIPSLVFLPKIETVQNDLQSLQKFTIKLDVSKTKVNELSYDLKDDELHIFITPSHGLLKSEDIKTHSENFKYDLIVTLDVADLESLGKVFEENQALFFETPIINIDHKPDNEHFGAINLVDLTSSATSEVVYNHLETWDRSLINEEAATCLLAGLIAKTQSFKEIKSPKTFQAAGRLITLGAEREKIMQNLYRQHSLATFKLWGVTLAHIKYETNLKFAWSTLTNRDFLITGGEESELPAVIQELVLSSKDIENALLLYEKPAPATNYALFFSTKIKDVDSLLLPSLPNGAELISRGPGFASFYLVGKNLLETEQELIDLMKKKLYNVKVE